MSAMLDGVDRRTRLVGENRLELLLFKLATPQLYGINVFKVQEVICCPRLTSVPNSHYTVRGIANMRGRTIPVIDLGQALGQSPMSVEEVKDSFVIIADYNRSLQGFLVNGVERIVNMNWQDILAPPKGSGVGSYLTAVTHVDEKLVEIIDVEKVWEQIVGLASDVSDEVLKGNKETTTENIHVLVVDDSSVARKQIKRTLDQVGIQCTLANDGKEALEFLLDLASEEGSITDRLALVISDVEMPNMDGYTLTTEVRRNSDLKDLYVILHTSLSGVFNEAMVKKVGANKFIAKFNPDELADAVLSGINSDRNKISGA